MHLHHDWFATTLFPTPNTQYLTPSMCKFNRLGLNLSGVLFWGLSNAFNLDPDDLGYEMGR